MSFLQETGKTCLYTAQILADCLCSGGWRTEPLSNCAALTHINLVCQRGYACTALIEKGITTFISVISH